MEYVKTSIEILMNMRLEEYQLMQARRPPGKETRLLSKGLPSHRDAATLSSCESFVSLDEPPKDYEIML